MKDEANQEKANEWSDAIVEEVHATREHHARKFNFDMEAIVEDLRRRQEKSEREVVSFSPKRVGESRAEEGLA